MSEENKAVSRRFFEEMMSSGNLDLFEELASPEIVNYDPAQPEAVHGIEGGKEVLSGYVSAFPDLKMSVEDQVAEGDKVFTRWVAEGTHEGELFGVPASGNHVRVEGMTVDRFEGGKIIESWDNWDALGLMQQIGAIPAEQPA
jgi:steroid delta-isomerase-like uncharacterized protein